MEDDIQVTRFFLFICCFILSAPLSQSEEPPVGFVTDMVLHGHDLTNLAGLKLFAPFANGDEIALTNPKSFVVLALAEGEVRVTLSNSPFSLKSATSIEREEWTLISAIGAIFSGDEVEQVPDNMVSRGENLEIPMMAARTNYLDANRRKLWLGWVGGVAPYNVTIEFPNAPQFIAAIAGMDVEINLAQSLPKQVFVSLGDAKGTLKRFRIRSTNTVPVVPIQLGNSPLAKAGWLLRQDDGKWRLEAAQLLWEKALNQNAAERVAKKIAAGALL